MLGAPPHKREKTGSTDFYLKYLEVCFFRDFFFFLIVLNEILNAILFDIWTNSFSEYFIKVKARVKTINVFYNDL